MWFFFFFQAEDGIRDTSVTGVQTCALPILGDDMAVRLPRIPGAVGQVEQEHRWLPRLAPLLPLAGPAPLAKGTPGEGYPWSWSVYRWLEGEDAAVGCIADPVQAARELARFVAALRRVDTAGGPPPGPHNSLRGVPLAARDASTRATRSPPWATRSTPAGRPRRGRPLSGRRP